MLRKNDNKRKNNESGAIIVEASIALTVFIFAIVSILFVSHICYAQAKIGTVIDGVAKDLSEFSYIYSLTGLANKHSKINSDASVATESIDNVIANLTDVGKTLNNLKELGSSLKNDSEMQSSMIALLKNEGANKIESIAASVLVKKFAGERLSSVKGNCETLLKNLGVEKKASTYLGSIDFSDTVFCVNGSSEIKVVARYSVKLIKLLNIDITYDICQCASTKAWGAAEKSNEEIASSSEEKDKDDDEKDVENSKTIEEIAEECTKNPNSDKVVIGTGEQLTKDADRIGATYFDVNEIEDCNYDNWEIIKVFLEQNKDKTFYINCNPYENTDPLLKKQIIWLQDHGYKFRLNALGYWEAYK